MGTRGPKPGFKQAQQAKQEGAATPLSSMSATDRENPDKLAGDELRELAHRRGLSRSALDDMDDTKIRRELRMVTYRQYEEEVA